MRSLLISDLHLGVQRSGGTTIASAQALRAWAHERHRDLLQLAVTHGCQRVIVNGDLTDQYDTPLSEGLEVLSVAKEFLEENPDKVLVWVLGNHDLSKDSAKLGIVAFLGAILQGWFPGRFFLISRPIMLEGGVYVIPHLANQDLFDRAMAQVPDGTKHLLLHCNFDNTFAGAQDHSLNLSRAQAKAFRERGIKVLLGHEHQGRELLGGAVVIVGNQFPTSVADCLSHGDAQKDGKKYALIIDGDSVERVQTWGELQEGDGWFGEIDWRELKDVTETDRGFIRVTGEAGAAEAAMVIKEISAFRQRAQSFVVTNAVKIEGVEASEEELVTQEDIRQVDVIALLLELVDEPQAARICELLGRERRVAEE